MATFADTITTLREERNKKRQEVADDLGISRASLEYYEKGKRKPDIEILEKIADYYGVSADYLLGRTKAISINEELKFVCNYLGITEEAADTLKTAKFITETGNSSALSGVFEQALQNNFLINLCLDVGVYCQCKQMKLDTMAIGRKGTREKMKHIDKVHFYETKCEASLYRIQKLSTEFCENCAKIYLEQRDGATNGNDQ